MYLKEAPYKEFDITLFCFLILQVNSEIFNFQINEIENGYKQIMSFLKLCPKIGEFFFRIFR